MQFGDIDGVYWDGDLLKYENTMIASNKDAGTWTVDRMNIAGWFFKPGTVWDGCVDRAIVPTVDDDWWSLQKKINVKEDEI